MVAAAQRAIDPLKIRTRWTKDPAKLRTLTWDQMKELGSTRRLAIINDFRTHRISIGVRLNIDAAVKRVALLTDDQALAERVRTEGLSLQGPHPESFLPSDEQYPEETYHFTGEWQDFPALVAFWFHAMRTQRAEMGGSFVQDGYVVRRGPDGEKIPVWFPKNVPYAELFEFRGPGDIGTAATVARRGIVLPRTRIPDLDNLPEATAAELANIEDILTGALIQPDGDESPGGSDDDDLYDEEPGGQLFTPGDDDPITGQEFADLAVITPPKPASRPRNRTR